MNTPKGSVGNDLRGLSKNPIRATLPIIILTVTLFVRNLNYAAVLSQLRVRLQLAVARARFDFWIRCRHLRFALVSQLNNEIPFILCNFRDAETGLL